VTLVVYVPVATVADVVMFNEEVAVPPEDRMTLAGFRFQVSPWGAVFVCKFTDPPNPLRLVSVIVEKADVPCWTVMLLGFDEIEKSGVGGGELTMNCPVIELV
jgi:hypothetical protein